MQGTILLTLHKQRKGSTRGDKFAASRCIVETS